MTNESKMDPNLRQLLLYQDYDVKLKQCEWASGENAKIIAALRKAHSDGKESLELERMGHKKKLANVQLSELALMDKESHLKTLERKRDRIVKGVQAVALEAEMETSRREKEREEERHLEAMEALELEEKDLQRKEARATQALAKVASQLNEAEGRQSRLLVDLGDLKKKLTQIETHISRPWMDAYGSVRNSPLLPPYVCRLEGFLCSGCRLRLVTMGSGGGANRGAEIHRCEHCNRILYVAEEEGCDENGPAR